MKLPLQELSGVAGGAPLTPVDQATSQNRKVTTATAHLAVQDLLDQLPEGAVLTDPDLMGAYRTDWAKDPDAGMPCAVVRATSTADVQAVLRIASAHNVPVVPRGAGSGLSGGSTAVDGGIVLSMERMRAIEVDTAARVAVVQPGLLNAEVKRAVAVHGLWYPPDPSSFEMCSIGGNLATNAGGLCCVKYGVTTDYVLGMEVVLADGRAIRLGGPMIKNVAGLSLTKLFVGSEGTLGMITEATLRLVPQPSPASTLVAMFADVESAAAAVLAITMSTRPSMLELMDQGAINAVEDYVHMELDRTAGALLIAQSDLPGVAAGHEIAAMEVACAANGATEVFSTDDPAEGEQFAVARRAAFPAIEAMGALFLEDVGVALPKLPALLAGIKRIAAQTGAHVPVVAHAGDGNTHPLVVYTPGDEQSEQNARLAFGLIMDLAISLGGTITGEHGVGRLKAPWLARQLGEDVMELNRTIKAALDPQGILNPGSFV
jgi:glycolate oxidase